MDLRDLVLGGRGASMNPFKSMADTREIAPSWFWTMLNAAPLFKGIAWQRDYEEDPDAFEVDQRQKTTLLPAGEVFASGPYDEFADVDSPAGYHVPALDIDHDLVAWQSSSGNGHWHLVIDQMVPQGAYFRLLDALVECDIIEAGFAEASKRRGASHLRLPWIHKGTEREDAARAMAEFLDADRCSDCGHTKPEHLYERWCPGTNRSREWKVPTPVEAA